MMDGTAVRLLLKERALEATSEGVVIVDALEPGMPIIYVNPAFTAITGYGPQDVLGSNCRFLQGPQTDSAARRAIHNAIVREHPCKVEILNYRKDGTPFWNLLSITPVRDETGQTTHFIGIQSDVTRRRKAEDSLRQANEQLKRDLQAAAMVQQAQLPRTLPQGDAMRFAWRYAPCQELAGDTLNIQRLDDDRIAVYILDVSGHGVRAALQSFALNQDLRFRPGGPNLYAPQQVLERLNLKYPLDMQTGIFFTILYGVINAADRTFTYASAGHPGPLLIRPDAAPQLLETQAYPIGVIDNPGYRPRTLHLQAGDTLLLYTDGLVDALNARDETFGQTRLLTAVRDHRSQTIDELLDTVMQAVENWSRHTKMLDDISLVGIQVDGAP